MKKIKLICAAFIFLFVCCLLCKPASAASPASNRNGAKLYFGGYSNYIDCFNTKTGKLTSMKSTYLHWSPDTLKYYKGYFYGFNSHGHQIRLTKTGNLLNTYKHYGACIYKNYMFYRSNSSVRRCNTNGGNDIRIIKNHDPLFITVLKNKLYYIRLTRSRTLYLYSATLNGKKARKICKLKGDILDWAGASPFVTYGSSIYAGGPDGIYRFSPGWNSMKKIVSFEEDAYFVTFAGMHKNDIYFNLSSNKWYLCKAKKSGGDYEVITRISEESPISAVGSGNYCLYKKGHKYYSMTLSGKKKRRLYPKSLY